MDEYIKMLWFEDGYVKIQTNKNEILSQPLEVFPALFCATPVQKEKYYLWDDNRSVRWEELDEDIHISGQRTGAVGDTHFIDVVNCKMINFAG